MGYTTDFKGCLTFDKPLTAKQVRYINTFSGTRRMKRAVKILQALYHGEHGLDGNYGNEGEYFCKYDGEHGQGSDASILDYNEAPGTPDISMSDFSAGWELRQKYITDGKCQPGLWCQWVVSDDGTTLEWNEREKFYHYTEWLKYLIAHFFDKWGNKLNGEIKWQGEDDEDKGLIIVENNIVSTKEGKTVYE